MSTSFLKFMTEVIEERMGSRAAYTLRNYKASKRLFEQFENAKYANLPVEDLDALVIENFEKYLLGTLKVKKNTSSAYLRPLRCIYNQAVERGLCTDKHPFSKVYTGIEKTRKRALTLDTLKKVFTWKIVDDEELALFRDLFAFSFFTHGMSFIEMAKLQMGNISNGEINYQRSKTHNNIRIRMDSQALKIIGNYHKEGDEYVFPLFENGFNYNEYNTLIHKYNRNLKRLSKMMELDCQLTTYCARHSWATIAYKEQVPISVISNCLGHSTELMTHIYLQSIDDGEIDRQCSKVSKLFDDILA